METTAMKIKKQKWIFQPVMSVFQDVSKMFKGFFFGFPHLLKAEQPIWGRMIGTGDRFLPWPLGSRSWVVLKPYPGRDRKNISYWKVSSENHPLKSAKKYGDMMICNRSRRVICFFKWRPLEGSVWLKTKSLTGPWDWYIYLHEWLIFVVQ